ncbi:uncharacterized protein ARMOST_15027 [Armillaria ostoyae]|uniref:Uncharacterized protein n=1 Tax=Armillaria ostoyae TaxID=47428 RepID=A0A284RS80_ARMOS|nr:uncharacterized protein ARMOST_15027 [Armillaria ostoyae]
MSWRTAIITDSAKSIWKTLARNGFNVAINNFLSEKAKRVNEVVAIGVQCPAYMADVSNEQEVKSMNVEVVSDFGGLDTVRHLLVVLSNNLLSEAVDGCKRWCWL